MFPGADKLTAAIRRPPHRRFYLGRCALASVAAGPWRSCQSPGRCSDGQQGQSLIQAQREPGQGRSKPGAGLTLRTWPFWAHGANPMGVRSLRLQPKHHGRLVWPGPRQPGRRRNPKPPEPSLRVLPPHQQRAQAARWPGLGSAKQGRQHGVNQGVDGVGHGRACGVLDRVPGDRHAEHPTVMSVGIQSGIIRKRGVPMPCPAGRAIDPTNPANPGHVLLTSIKMSILRPIQSTNNQSFMEAFPGITDEKPMEVAKKLEKDLRAIKEIKPQCDILIKYFTELIKILYSVPNNNWHFPRIYTHDINPNFATLIKELKAEINSIADNQENLISNDGQIDSKLLVSRFGFQSANHLLEYWNNIITKLGV